MDLISSVSLKRVVYSKKLNRWNLPNMKFPCNCNNPKF